MPISIAKVSLARVDALSVYTLVLAQCLALQVVKDAQTLTWHVTGAWRALPTVALALAVLRAHARPGDTRSALALAAAGLLALTVNGSQSNHVLLELALCAATLLAAPGGCFSRSEARRDASRRFFSHASRRVRNLIYGFRFRLFRRAFLLLLLLLRLGRDDGFAVR